MDKPVWLQVRLRELFEASAIKTIGDVADSLEGFREEAKKLPEDIRNHSLGPDESLILPDSFFISGQKAGLSLKTLARLGREAALFKEGLNRAATRALQP